MLIIGLNNTGHISSAAAVMDGQLVFGCAQERIDRQKQTMAFPHGAIEACLQWLGASLSEVDCFAIGWNPGINVAGRYRAGFSQWPGYPGARLFSNPNHLLPRMGEKDYTVTEQVFHTANGEAIRFSYVMHHLAHCANAYYLSGFNEAAIFSCDGYSERATTVWAKASGDSIKVLRQIEFPHSIGFLYATITEFLGFRPEIDEWKVMGAAAYGDAESFYPALQKLIRYDEDGRFEMEMSYFSYYNFDTQGMYSSKLEDLLGPPRRSDEPLEQRHFDLAASLQKLTEDYLMTAIEWLSRETGLPNLCLSGGVAMNSVFNGKASLHSSFQNIYIPFAPDDSGNSIGAALWEAQRCGDLRGEGVSASPYLGREYSNEEIAASLHRYGIPYTTVNDIEQHTAKILSEGQIVGWFQGRMEFGQRALGSRSILGDPRDAATKERVNNAVKYREAFRPFAPTILEECVADYFEVGGRPPAVPYMEKVFPIRSAVQSRVPAVVHADGTGRLQSINRQQNARYYDLVKAFQKVTGVPVVLNTSFNLNGEPIVESPTDAIRTFFSSGMDTLVMGNYLVQKG